MGKKIVLNSSRKPRNINSSKKPRSINSSKSSEDNLKKKNKPEERTFEKEEEIVTKTNIFSKSLAILNTTVVLILIILGISFYSYLTIKKSMIYKASEEEISLREEIDKIKLDNVENIYLVDRLTTRFIVDYPASPDYNDIFLLKQNTKEMQKNLNRIATRKLYINQLIFEEQERLRSANIRKGGEKEVRNTGKKVDKNVNKTNLTREAKEREDARRLKNAKDDIREKAWANFPDFTESIEFFNPYTAFAYDKNISKWGDDMVSIYNDAEEVLTLVEKAFLVDAFIKYNDKDYLIKEIDFKNLKIIVLKKKEEEGKKEEHDYVFFWELKLKDLSYTLKKYCKTDISTDELEKKIISFYYTIGYIPHIKKNISILDKAHQDIVLHEVEKISSFVNKINISNLINNIDYQIDSRRIKYATIIFNKMDEYWNKCEEYEDFADDIERLRNKLAP